MHRRQFVNRLGLTLVGLKFELLAGCGTDDSNILEVAPDSGAAADVLNTLAGTMTGIDFVGPVCRSRVSDGQLESGLLNRLKATGAKRLSDAFQIVLAEDFRTGRTEIVEGWFLSITECRLAALAAVRQGLQAPSVTELGEAVEVDFVRVIDWGPRKTYEGQLFNPQGHGKAGFWIQVAEQAPGSTRLIFDGQVLTTHVHPETITASLDKNLADTIIYSPGIYQLTMFDEARGRYQQLGSFVVHEKPPPAILEDGTESTVFCQIERWGPHSAPAGQAFNEQPDGAASFWIRTGCAAANAILILGDHELPTRVRSGLVSARVVEYAELESGTYPLQLVDPDSGERVFLGDFKIH